MPQSKAGNSIKVGESRIAGSSVGKWISYNLALPIVAKAGRLDARNASKWLRDSSLPPQPVVRARVSPSALAQRHLKMKREGRLLQHPNRALILSGDLCAWLPPDEALVQGKGIETALGVEFVQWREDELCAALARAFPAKTPDTSKRLSARPEPEHWIPFALAQAEAAKTLGYPENAAGEWLRQAVLAGHIGVRFSDRYVRLHPTNLRLAGHPANLTEEERALPWPQPISPLDDLKQGPAAMAEHRIAYHTEWNARQVRAALNAVVDAGSASSPKQAAGLDKTDRKGIGGPKRKYPWDELGAGFGAWLHDAPGRADLSDDEHLDALAALAHRLGCEVPPRTTAQPYLAKWLRGFRAFLEID